MGQGRNEISEPEDEVIWLQGEEIMFDGAVWRVPSKMKTFKYKLTEYYLAAYWWVRKWYCRMTGAPMMTGWLSHRWSGWPGAVCMLCGMEDPSEIALADGTMEDSREAQKQTPSCPANTKGLDPYKIPVE